MVLGAGTERVLPGDATEVSASLAAAWQPRAV